MANVKSDSQIKDPAQPVEAIIIKYVDKKRAEVGFAPAWRYSSAPIKLLDEISYEDFPVGSKVVVDNAIVRHAMAVIRAYSIDGRIIADNHPGATYKKSQLITF